MRKIAIAAAVALLAAGCAHKPSDPPKQQVNRVVKADKYAAPKKVAPVEMPTPNQTVQKRWFPKFRIKWVH